MCFFFFSILKKQKTKEKTCGPVFSAAMFTSCSLVLLEATVLFSMFFIL